MIPERSGNLRDCDIAGLHPPHARKLARHSKLRRAHRRNPDVMNDIDRTLRNVSALNQIAKLALVEAGLEPITQPGHSEIAKMRTDAKSRALRRTSLREVDVAAWLIFGFPNLAEPRSARQ